jgi:gamma-glutamylcysteine synthetase
MKTINEVINSKEEQNMRNSFRHRSSNVLNQEKNYIKKGEHVGFELETQIVDKNTLEIAPEEVRNSLIKYKTENFDKELGAGQLEIKTPPLKLFKGLGFLESELDRIVDDGNKFLYHNHGNKYGFLMMGAHPTSDISNIKRSNAEKYRLVPNFHNDYQGNHIDTIIGDKDTIDSKDAAIIGLMTSIQCNIEATNFKDAIDKMNRSFMIGNYIIATTTNARFVDGKDTGISDIRMTTWETSHDLRTPEQIINHEKTRIGLPKSHYKDMKDYLEKISMHPFILNTESQQSHAFEIGVGLNWNDTRVKFNREKGHAIVEFRPISTQPTIKENIASMAFYIGRLEYSQMNREPILDMRFIEINREQVMKKGMEGRITYFDNKGELRVDYVKNILPNEIEKAYHGLINKGINKNEATKYLNLITERLYTGTPADQLSKKIYSSNNIQFKQNLIEKIKQQGLIR